MVRQRSVDAAMAEERPEKHTIRGLWLELLQQIDRPDLEVPPPLYMTLSGALGMDIELLSARGLVKKTETGAVHPDHYHKFIAVESSPTAVLALQKKFPGLKILEVSFVNLVRSSSPTAWPTGEHKDLCRARVINLDLNAGLVATEDQGQVVFPLLTVVRKLCQVHALPPQLDWHLLLTIDGRINWTEEVGRAVQAFLAENFRREVEFADGSRGFLGKELYEQIDAIRVQDCGLLDSDNQQALLMLLVPKKIVQLVHDQGWRLVTLRNLRYGGTADRAPMVTWLLHFTWDPRATRTPDAVYRDSLKTVLNGAGRIAQDGSMT